MDIICSPLAISKSDTAAGPSKQLHKHKAIGSKDRDISLPSTSLYYTWPYRDCHRDSRVNVTLTFNMTFTLVMDIQFLYVDYPSIRSLCTSLSCRFLSILLHALISVPSYILLWDWVVWELPFVTSVRIGKAYEMRSDWSVCRLLVRYFRGQMIHRGNNTSGRGSEGDYNTWGRSFEGGNNTNGVASEVDIWRTEMSSWGVLI